MNAYGYPTSQLFGMLSLDAYNPYSNNSYNNHYGFVSVSTPSNLFYGAPSFDGKTNCTQYPPVENYPNWLSTVNDQVDLRQVFLKCNATTGLFQQVVQWGACYDTTSPISGQPVCYSTEALYYAQSGYFSTVVLIQWSNIFACKSRKASLIYSALNRHMLYGVLTETLLFIFLLYTPGVNGVFGGRPLNFFMLCPALLFSIFLLCW